MHSQLEPASGTPCTTRALLSMYMHMITLKRKLDFNGLPPQWQPQPVRHTTIEQHTTTGKQPTQKSSKPTSSITQTNPLSSTTATIRTNAQWPHIFTSNDTLKLLQANNGQILTEIFSKASIGRGGDRLDLTGLLDNLCLRWLILGKCSGGHQGQECNCSHPTTSIPTKAAEAVFCQIEPGLKHMAKKHKKQRTECQPTHIAAPSYQQSNHPHHQMPEHVHTWPPAHVDSWHKIKHTSAQHTPHMDNDRELHSLLTPHAAHTHHTDHTNSSRKCMACNTPEHNPCPMQTFPYKQHNQCSMPTKEPTTSTQHQQ